MLHVLHDVQGGGIEPVGKRVINQKRGDHDELRLVGMFDPVSLQGTEIIAVAEGLEDLLL